MSQDAEGRQRRRTAPHTHASGADVDRRAARLVWYAVAAVALVTLGGVVALWPSGSDDGARDPAELGERPVEASVRAVDVGPCAGTAEADGIECRLVRIALAGGPTEGQTETLEQAVASGPAALEAGDEILVTVTPLEDGSFIYSFYDHQRGRPLLVLGVLFVGAVLLLGRWKGLGALAGLAASLLVLVLYVLPSLLDGNDAVAVALVGASVIAFIALLLAHGAEVGTGVALLGTLASLALTALLGWAFVRAADFTGFVDESSFFLQALGTNVDARGILLAGIVIGSLGVLDDVTVTQVSVVSELRRAQPELTSRQLYRSAISIGRDHISSTVNTLFLAYAGAALPLLLLFSEAEQSIVSVSTREVVATEVVRALVGSIGLVASVPITTALAVRVLAGRSTSVVRRSADRRVPIG